MDKGDISGGAIVGTILVVGGIVCVLGYQKMNEPVYKESSYKSVIISDYSKHQDANMFYNQDVNQEQVTEEETETYEVADEHELSNYLGIPEKQALNIW